VIFFFFCYGKIAEVTKSLCNLIVCDDEMKLCLVRNVACVSPWCRCFYAKRACVSCTNHL